MNVTDQPHSPPAGPAGDPPPAHRPLPVAGLGVPTDPDDVVALEGWFDRLAADRVHPEIAAARMRRAGWSDGAIVWADTRYRARWPSHPAIWWGGFTAIGTAALSVAGVLHSLIDGHRQTAAAWFGVAVVALVFAAVAAVLMGRLSDDWSQRFSSARRAAATTLFWAAIAAAVLRGLVYGQVLGHELLVGDHCRTEYDYDPASGQSATEVCTDRGVDALGHLGLTAVVAGPVACWSWYLHRRPTDAPAVDPSPSAG